MQCRNLAMVGVYALCVSFPLSALGTEQPQERTIRVPQDQATIQGAIDAAADGDTVLVAPGEYHEPIRISGKSIVLASEYLTNGNEKLVRETILDGTIRAADGTNGIREQVILVEDNAGPKTKIIGFTIRNGDDGIRNFARIHIAHNYFTGNEDAIDNEGGGGVCEHNLFEKNKDDAVDYDLDSAGVVAHNVMRDNDDDGIEIRLHDHTGEPLQIVFRDNIITGNGEDGIQIIDYPGVSNRHIRIEGNVIARNAMSGIGLMSDGITKEDYRGANIPEPIEVINNTIVENEYGITGGACLTAFNNVIAGNKQLALKKVGGKSLAAHNLVWNNGTDFVDSNVDAKSTIQKDPKLNAAWQPEAGSPCIDGGVGEFVGATGRIEIDRQAITGKGPDLGAIEAAATANDRHLP